MAKKLQKKLEERKGGPQLEPYQILLRSLITEKGVQQAEEQHTYAFEVNKLVTKSEIKAAVEALYDVKVVSVNTLTRKGKAKTKRTRGGVVTGVTKTWKKAIVKLSEEDTIDFF